MLIWGSKWSPRGNFLLQNGSRKGPRGAKPTSFKKRMNKTHKHTKKTTTTQTTKHNNINTQQHIKTKTQHTQAKTNNNKNIKKKTKATKNK